MRTTPRSTMTRSTITHRLRPGLLLASLALSAVFLAPTVIRAQSLSTELVVNGLSQPLFLTHAPADNDRLFVVERTGRIRIIENGTLLPAPFLNIQSQVDSSWLEWGVLGLAFHPDYSNNGFFFVNYVELGGDSIIARFQVSANPNVADAASEQRILYLDQPNQNHRGGWMDFGPDGYLYDFQGDGGPQQDPFGRAQNLSLLQGKVLRLDVDGPDGIPGTADDDGFPADPDRHYHIPIDNPFVGITGADEIWSYGLRNPWRGSFDRDTGDLWIGDVGQYAREEINVQPASSTGGENYGWRCIEGFLCTGLTGCTCTSPDLVPPVHDYNHGFGTSITCGYVYRGCAIPNLDGTFFFADYTTARIWSFRYDGATTTEFQERTAELEPPGAPSISTLSSFGEDAQGEIYILDYNGGEVFRIVSATPITPDPCVSGGPNFVRGDANQDLGLDIGDAIATLDYLFASTPSSCPNALDSNDDEGLDIADAIFLLQHLFSLGPAPSVPQVCGEDPTPGALDCPSFSACP